MPFITACPFCPVKMKVPDKALGASLRCPKCGSYFTVARAEEVAEPVRPPAVGEVTRPPAEPAPPADLPWWVSATPAAAPAPPPPQQPAPAPAPAPVAVAPLPIFPDVSPPAPAAAGPGWVNAGGAVALFLASLALLGAAFTLPRLATIALAGLGVLVGLAGAVAARAQWQVKDTVWLCLGAGGNGVLLILALFLPGWLNARWGMDFAVPEPDLNRQIMVSRDNLSEVKELTGGERVYAESNAIRQGDILIRVESAAVDRPQGVDQPLLLISLTIANVGHLHNVTYHGQARGGQGAVVRDSRGKDLPRRDLGAQAKKAGQVGTVVVLPTHEVKDVLAVEAPWSGTAYVEVDLPAAAWGRGGVCQFTIPTIFISRSRPK